MKGTIKITVAGEADTARQADKRNKQVSFKNCSPFTNCISEINDIPTDNAEDLDFVMPMYSLIDYSNNYAKNIRKSVEVPQGCS